MTRDPRTLRCDVKASLFQQEVIDKPCEERGGEPAPTCLWCSCVVEADSRYIMRHLYYHAFHTKLMARGGHLAQINKWPVCRADSSNRVVIPIIPGPFVCGWRLCDFQANNVDIFYAHVEGHPQVRNLQWTLTC